MGFKIDLVQITRNTSFFQENANDRVKNKLDTPMNQAYVEAVASYCLSKLREGNVSPHFHYFYGAFRGVSETYSYNISDVFSTYRHCRWFWDHQESGIFQLSVDNEENLNREVLDAIFDPPSEIHSETSSDTQSEEELENLDGGNKQETIELESLDTTSMASVSCKESSDDDDAADDASEAADEDEDADDDDDDDNDSLNVLAKIKNFPVMLLFTESSKGTMDQLLENFEEIGEIKYHKQTADINISCVNRLNDMKYFVKTNPIKRRSKYIIYNEGKEQIARISVGVKIIHSIIESEKYYFVKAAFWKIKYTVYDGRDVVLNLEIVRLNGKRYYKITSKEDDFLTAFSVFLLAQAVRMKVLIN